MPSAVQKDSEIIPISTHNFLHSAAIVIPIPTRCNCPDSIQSPSENSLKVRGVLRGSHCQNAKGIVMEDPVPNILRVLKAVAWSNVYFLSFDASSAPLYVREEGRSGRGAVWEPSGPNGRLIFSPFAHRFCRFLLGLQRSGGKKGEKRPKYTQKLSQKRGKTTKQRGV